MRTKMTAVMTALALAGASVMAVTPANAQWNHRHQHRGHGGGGASAGFAAGALLGGVLASQPRYYYREPYAYGGSSVQYCLSRFKSYDPASGTYLGYDGYRHPCP